MSLKPNSWSVVVAGLWNPAIFTPRWIATELFKLDDDSPIQVDVALDAAAPSRVFANGLTVSVTTSHFTVEPRESTFPELKRAMEVAAATVDRLQVTPLIAVGINVRYKSKTPHDLLQSVVALPMDDEIGDARLKITGRGIRRELEWNGGTVNTIVTIDDEDGTMVQFNIEKRSKSPPDYLAWLTMDISEIQKFVETFLTNVLHLSTEEIQ